MCSRDINSKRKTKSETFYLRPNDTHTHSLAADALRLRLNAHWQRLSIGGGQKSCNFYRKKSVLRFSLDDFVRVPVLLALQFERKCCFVHPWPWPMCQCGESLLWPSRNKREKNEYRLQNTNANASKLRWLERRRRQHHRMRMNIIIMNE